MDLLAIWSVGGTAVPIDSRMTDFEVETLAGAGRPGFSVWERSPSPALAKSLEGSGVTLLSSTEAMEAGGSVAPSAAPVGPDQDALILFTSGTTGQPKGVVHTYGSLAARWQALRQHLGVAEHRRTLCLLPTHFGHGLVCNALFPWLSGQHLFVLPPFRPDLLTDLGPLIDRHEITFLSSVPPVWRLALRSSRPPERGSLARVFCGSAPFPAQLWQGVREWSGARDVRNAYGITETGSWLAGPDAGEPPEEGLVGRAFGGELRVLPAGSEQSPAEASPLPVGEAGLVWVKTPALMRGYLDREDLTRAVVTDGWFLTGDIGYFDDRGRLFLRGREREEINKGGMKVYPADIDSVVERFEGATDVCAFAVPDPLLGEEVAVAVVLSQSDPAVLSRLYDWAAAHLARHQMPSRWYLLAEIPRTSRGKVNRAAIAEHCRNLSPAPMPRSRSA